jgi:hypothetical protein
MKPKTTKKLCAFIITVMMFSVMPALVNAQKKCPNGHCPKGYICFGGYCVESLPGGCNCFVRPISAACAPTCGFLAGKTPANDLLSISGIDSTAISLELIESQNVSLKIYDITGRLIKTLADEKMEEGNHQIEWNKTDEAGNTVSAGIYILQFDTANTSETRKLSVN